MNRGILYVSLLVLGLLPLPLQAQNRVEGSRPGETYRVGESAPSQDSQAPQAQPVQPQAQPGQPQYQQIPQYQMNPNADPQQMQRNVEAKSRAGRSAGMPVIMEFSDLQCPDSARYNSGLKNQVMQRFVSSGRASYEWHDFPLPSHAQAQEAAAAARCAGQASDRVRQQIMANQGEMSANVFAGYARQAGADPDEFASCVRSGSSMREVMNDKALGESLGVRGTPTLVVGVRGANGRINPVKVVKAYNPPQQVLAEIDTAMASVGQQGSSGQQPGAAQLQPAIGGQQPLPVSQPAY